MYRLFGIDYFDSVLLTGDYQANDLRMLEQQRHTTEKRLVTVGCSYLDVYNEKLSKITADENHHFTVLVSPSWGPSAILSRFGEKLLDPLLKLNWQIIIRPHPQSQKSETMILEKLTKKYEGLSNLTWDYERENIYSLAKADIMISDFSGIIYDYVLLFDKPVIYVNQGFDLRPYDAYDLVANNIEGLWQFRTLRKIGVELREEEFSHISDLIKEASDSEDLRKARRKAKETAWQYPGEAGKRIVDYLTNAL